MNNELKILSPENILRISKMEIRAKLVVEGFLTGMHKSPFHGFSVEFAEFRQYLPGDEIKKMDWKAYARTDKFYIKKYEDETNLLSNIIIDKSASMNFTSHKITKLEYAASLAAALSYLSIGQRDAVGLTLFDEKINYYLKPHATKAQLKRILIELQKIKGFGISNISKNLNKISEKLTRKGLVIILSDFYDDPKDIINSLKRIRFNKHEIILFHILDPFEKDFNYNDNANFVDLESKENIKTVPNLIRKNYKILMNDFISLLKKESQSQKIDYVLVNTKTPFEISLTRYLDKRSKII